MLTRSLGKFTTHSRRAECQHDREAVHAVYGPAVEKSLELTSDRRPQSRFNWAPEHRHIHQVQTTHLFRVLSGHLHGHQCTRVRSGPGYRGSAATYCASVVVFTHINSGDNIWNQKPSQTSLCEHGFT